MRVVLRTLTVAAVLPLAAARAQQPPAADTAWTCRAEMVPMRDGIRLQTTIVAPGAAARPLPFIVQRTP